MDNDQRLAAYYRQNGAQRLTARQRKRVKLKRASAVEGTVPRERRRRWRPGGRR